MTARVLMATMIAMLVSVPLLAARKKELNDGRPGATVLCYHIVESPKDPMMEITRETFRQHLQYLEMTGYNVIPLRHLYEYVSGKRESIPENAVVITIDDGWRSAYTEAYPELKKRGFPFTLFVYPNIINKTGIALTWDQIREMQEDGADIQSHTFSHAYLSRRRHDEMDDEEYATWLRKELVDSKKKIEKETGKTVEFLAYPYGDFDSRVAATVEHAGYSAALTCVAGRVHKGSDPFRMKRVVIDKTMDFATFRAFMGASQIELAEETPAREWEPGRTVVSARIPNHESLDPRSVGMALLSANSVVPYAYDATTGAISLVLNDPLKGDVHRALVWGRDAKTGKRVEGSWTFRTAAPETPANAPVSVGAAGGAR
jgi:peptidoglycan/xylan/chitin deacetylase (PgdA/CDA1 family)